MPRSVSRALALVVALVLGALMAIAPAPATAAGVGEAHRRPAPRPVIFVHGGAGSGAQFESQALRLTSNGYPADRIAVHEYDSTFGLNTMADVWAGLDTLIADLLAETGADRVDLLGHSLGTAVSHGYLNSSPERAARVAHYVNIDGQSSATEPGGVETLAVWGEGNPARQIGGAENWYAPDQAHVQVATSAETFAQFYEFFTGRPPRTTRVVPEHGRITLSGRASLFPANVGADDATLRVWKVDGRTGRRESRRPLAVVDIGADGRWGPLRARTGEHYEMTLTNEVSGTHHHFYFPPFVRSDHLVRLLTGEPGTGIDLLREKSPNHSSLAVTRYKEWWGDQGAGNDVLTVDGTSVLNAANAPRTKARQRHLPVRRRQRRGHRSDCPAARAVRPAVHHRHGRPRAGGRPARRPGAHHRPVPHRPGHHGHGQRAELALHRPPRVGAALGLRPVPAALGAGGRRGWARRARASAAGPAASGGRPGADPGSRPTAARRRRSGGRGR